MASAGLARWPIEPMGWQREMGDQVRHDPAPQSRGLLGHRQPPRVPEQPRAGLHHQRLGVGRGVSPCLASTTRLACGRACPGSGSAPGRPRSTHRTGSRAYGSRRSMALSVPAAGGEDGSIGPGGDRSHRRGPDPLVHRADVEARRTPDACSAARPDGSARTSVRPLSMRTTWTFCGPSPGVTPVRIVVGGSSAHRCCRGSSWRKTSRSAKVGTTFRYRQPRSGCPAGQAHPPIAPDSTTTSVPVSATAKFAPEIAPKARRLLPEVTSGRARNSAGSSVRSAGVASQVPSR